MDEHKVHLRPPLWLPVIVVLILGGSFVYGKQIESRGAPATISVSGEGKVTAAPDIASLSFGVETGRKRTAQAAMESLQTSMQAIIDGIQEEGIAERDIRTQSLRLNPAYDWEEGTRIERGFEAFQNLNVKVRDLEKVGKVLSAATLAGANQVGGVSFTIDEPDALREQARAEAIDDAKEKAMKLAGELGVRLGKLRGFNEGGGAAPMYMERAMMMDSVGMGGGGPEPMPVPGGEQEIQVNVNLTYEVK